MNVEQWLMVLACKYQFELVWKLPHKGTLWVAVHTEGVYLMGSLDAPVESWDMFETRGEAVSALIQATDKEAKVA
jgi:hypothetical protein